MAKGQTILLVDDDPAFLETTKIALENDFIIRTAANGQECLKSLEQEKPHLVILDVMMAHMGEGIDVANKMKNDDRFKDIPVIILTGVDEKFDNFSQVSAPHVHKNLWLEKPVEPVALLNKVKGLLSQN